MVFSLSQFDAKHKTDLSNLIYEYLKSQQIKPNFYFEDNRFFSFYSRPDNIILCYNEIIFFEKQLRKVLVHTTMGLYSYNGTLQHILSTVDRNCFIQVHHGFVVNKYKVKGQKNLELQMNHNDMKVPISKRRKKAVTLALLNITSDQ